jgi:hypothetical protein
MQWNHHKTVEVIFSLGNPYFLNGAAKLKIFHDYLSQVFSIQV